MEEIILDQYIIEIADSPRKTIPSSKFDITKKECVPVAREAFRNEGVTESDIELHVLDSSTTIFMKDSSGSIVAFSSSVIEKFASETIVHLLATAFLNKMKGKGYYNIFTPLRLLVESRKLQTNDFFVGTRTQSPIVFNQMSEKIGLYPRTDNPVPKNIRELGRAFAQSIYDHHSDFRVKGGMQFDESCLLQKMAYGHDLEDASQKGFCMYGDDIPWCRERAPHVDKYFRKHLNFDNGDAFVLLGEYQPEKVKAVLAKTRFAKSLSSFLEE